MGRDETKKGASWISGILHDILNVLLNSIIITDRKQRFYIRIIPSQRNRQKQTK